MNDRLKAIQYKSASGKLAQCVHHLADAGDRFVLDIAHNLQDIGTRAQAEASGMLESVGMAYDATRGLTHQLLSATEPTRGAPIERDPPLGSEPTPVTDSVSEDPDDALPFESSGVSVLRAECGQYDPNAPAVEEAHSAGILPVLQALERILHDDAPPRGRSLERDSRFWKVIELLHVLRPPQLEATPEEP